jgi:hypothetical protein
VQANLGLQFDLRNPLQRLTQDFSFELQLTLVWDVLVVASAALLEVRTARLDAIGRPVDQLRYRASREPRLLLSDLDVNPLPRQHKRNKHGHASPVCAGGSARQPVTAVD